VLVERSIQGIEHRLLVVGGKLVAANRSDLITVIGDGKSTVLELIETQVNTDRAAARPNFIRCRSSASIPPPDGTGTPEADADSVPAKAAKC
jgi:D-alanine-D-alanine ligase-like ATP-grasp enzyme